MINRHVCALAILGALGPGAAMAQQAGNWQLGAGALAVRALRAAARGLAGPGGRGAVRRARLQPTIGLDALIASAAGECFGLEPQCVSRALFPQVRRAGKPLQGLLRA